jgi:predicted TIM-barrel fold metal-dependent hydrolase
MNPFQSKSRIVRNYSEEKIDIFCHILPKKYNEALLKKAKPCYYMKNNIRPPALFDLDVRFRAMDKYEGLRQVLNLGVPPIEYVVSPKEAVDLARMANDEMAELVTKYPDRFVGAAAGLPMNDVDAAIREAERAIEELQFKGIQLYSPINGQPLDRPEFLGLYEKMSQHDLPIWIHPARDENIPDYPDETVSKYGLFSKFAWPFETTMAMARLVFSGILEKYPNLKFIPHHCGAMLPFFAGRVPEVPRQPGEVMKVTGRPLEYFKKFYADTVLAGNTAALMCGYAFFGADHMLFGTDYPYPGGAALGDVAIGDVIRSVELMNVTDEEKGKIFSRNARRILNLL